MPMKKLVSGALSIEDLAASLTSYEQLVFEELKSLEADDATSKTIATFVDNSDQLGPLFLCKSGAASNGRKLFSSSAFISGEKTGVDVYRLPLKRD